MTAQGKTVVTASVDMSTKQRAEKIFESVGLDMSTAINIYLKKVVAVNGIPFPITVAPMDEATLGAHEQVRQGEFDEFDGVDDWFNNLTSDD